MKKNGFTLTELLVVISILAILILISTTAYSSITKDTKEKAYKNLETYIITGAEDYIESNDIDTSFILVSDLIKEGYITADNDGTLKDPRDESVDYSNCYVINAMNDDNVESLTLTCEAPGK